MRLVGSSVKFIIARFSQKKHDNGRLQFSVKILSLDNYVTYIYTHYIYIHIHIIYIYLIIIYIYIICIIIIWAWLKIELAEMEGLSLPGAVCASVSWTELWTIGWAEYRAGIL